MLACFTSRYLKKDKQSARDNKARGSISKENYRVNLFIAKTNQSGLSAVTLVRPNIAHLWYNHFPLRCLSVSLFSPHDLPKINASHLDISFSTLIHSL